MMMGNLVLGSIAEFAYTYPEDNFYRQSVLDSGLHLYNMLLMNATKTQGFFPLQGRRQGQHGWDIHG